MPSTLAMAHKLTPVWTSHEMRIERIWAVKVILGGYSTMSAEPREGRREM